MPRAVVCRELGPPERLRLETFLSAPLAQAQVRVAIHAAAAGEARIKTLSAWAEAGKIRPHVSHRLRLENYAQAMRLLIDRKAVGRVALTMR